ncbi:MAG: hypothetical protein AAGA48_07350, partial [Myxococcota bacterium]
ELLIPTPPPTQTPLAEAAPRIWEALSRNEARKDVLLAHARQRLGGLPPEPAYGEDSTHHPQFLSRVPASWPGPLAAERAFALARAMAEGADASTLAPRAFEAALDAEEAALALDVLRVWGRYAPDDSAAPLVAKGLVWLGHEGHDVKAALEQAPDWNRWAMALDSGAASPDHLLKHLRERV